MANNVAKSSTNVLAFQLQPNTMCVSQTEGCILGRLHVVQFTFLHLLFQDFFNNFSEWPALAMAQVKKRRKLRVLLNRYILALKRVITCKYVFVFGVF